MTEILNHAKNDPTIFAKIDIGEDNIAQSKVVNTNSPIIGRESQIPLAPDYRIVTVKMTKKMNFDGLYLPEDISDKNKNKILNTFKELGEYMSKEYGPTAHSTTITGLSLAFIPITLMALIVLLGILLSSLALTIVGLVWGGTLFSILIFAKCLLKASERKETQIRCDARILMLGIFCFCKNSCNFAKQRIFIQPGKKAEFVQVHIKRPQVKIEMEDTEQIFAETDIDLELGKRCFYKEHRCRLESQSTIQSESAATQISSNLSFVE